MDHDQTRFCYLFQLPGRLGSLVRLKSIEILLKCSLFDGLRNTWMNTKSQDDV